MTAETIRRLLPGVLYLGSRFNVYSEAIVRAAAEHCDVVSFNIYEATPDVRRSDEYARKYDFPVLIGEFQFSSGNGSGLSHSNKRRACRNQAERAAAYVNYMEVAAKSAWCVGAHWFRYADQPYLGRAWDGENNNSGFVSCVDEPYADMVNAARYFHSRMYPMRMASSDAIGMQEQRQ